MSPENPTYRRQTTFTQSDNPVACYFRGRCERGEMTREQALEATVSFFLEDLKSLKWIIKTQETFNPEEYADVIENEPEYSDDTPVYRFQEASLDDLYQQEADQMSGLYIAVFRENNRVQSEPTTNNDDSWLILTDAEEEQVGTAIGSIFVTEERFRLDVVVDESTTPATLQQSLDQLLVVANTKRVPEIGYVVLRPHAIDHTNRFLPPWLKEQVATEKRQRVEAKQG